MAAPASSKSVGSKVVNPKLAMHVMAPYLSSGDCQINKAEGEKSCQPKPDSSSDDESDDLYAGDDDKGAQEGPAEDKDGRLRPKTFREKGSIR